MARVEISETVVREVNGTLRAVTGANVQVNVKGGGAATLYAAETGGTTLSNPVTTGLGRIEAWVEPGSYDLVVSGGGVASYTQRFEAVSSLLVESGEAVVAARQRLSALRAPEAIKAADTSLVSVPPAFVAPGGVSPIASPLTVPWTSKKLTRLGGTLTKYASAQAGERADAPSTGMHYSVEFDFYGAAVALRIVNRLASAAAVRMYVDDVPVTATGQLWAEPVSNAFGFLGATFPSTKWRRLRFDLFGIALGGVDLAATDVIAPTRKPLTKVAILGDSWTDYSTGAVTPVDGWAHTLGRLLGAEVFIHGQGGTGYSKDGASGRLKYNNATRLGFVLADDPDLIIVEGSSNDDSLADIQTNAAAVFAALAPTPVYVVGPPYKVSATQTAITNRQVNRDAVKAAAAAASNVIGFFDQLDPRGQALDAAAPPNWVANGTVYNAGDVVTDAVTGVVKESSVGHTSATTINSTFKPTSIVTGTGFQGATNGSGTSDVLTFTDGEHPSQAGHDLHARAWADAFLRVLNEIVAA